MTFWTICIYAAILYILVWFIKLFYRQRKFPHGPLPYPIVGNIPTLRSDTHFNLDQLANTYGPIFTLWFARTPIVFVNELQAAEEVFARNGSKFSDRPDFINKIITKRLTRLPYMNYCPRFQRNQAICSDAVNVEISYLDHVLSNTVLKLRTLFESKLDKNSFCPSDVLNNAVMNLMSEIIYGEEMSGASFDDFNLPGNKSVFSLINATSFFRPLRLLRLGRYLKFRQYIQTRERILNKMFDNAVKEKRHEERKTVMSIILAALNDEKDVNKLEEADLLSSDLFLVSIEKIAATLNWMFLYFITWPEIQLHVYEELRAIKLRHKDRVTVEEAQSIDFLKAAVYETLRLSSLSPLSTVHKTNDDVTLKGHKLPKGTCVCVNLNAIHHSPKYWDDPHQFNPARFLDQGNKLKDIDSVKGFFPFGRGLRKCFGDEITLKILTTIMANLILHFNFDVSPWHSKPSLTGSSRLILVPRPYFISISKR